VRPEQEGARVLGLEVSLDQRRPETARGT
jgi:hypothetical protein